MTGQPLLLHSIEFLPFCSVVVMVIGMVDVDRFVYCLSFALTKFLAGLSVFLMSM